MAGEFLVDLSELEEFEVVPPGMYVLEVTTRGDEKTEHGERAPYVRARFRVVEPSDYAGVVLTQPLMLAGKGTRLTASFLRALGYQVKRGDTVRLPLREANGRLVAAKVKHDEYRGEIRNAIEAFYPVDTAQADVAS